MKRIIFLLIGMLFIASGCSNEMLNTDSVLNEANLKQDISKMVPFKGEVFVSVDEYDADGLGIVGKMSGYFSHLGKFNETKSIWTNISHDLSQFPPMITFVQDVAFCAANGDFLYGKYTGTMDWTTSEVYGTFVIDGGTGRFENASGQSNADGYAWYDEYGRISGMYLAGEGEMSNVGSGK